jgi:hypothetical protein
MKRNYLLFIVLACFPCLSQSGVYKQIDEHGNVTYSNIPSNNAKKAVLPPIIVVPAVDSEDIQERLTKRRESVRNEEQRELIESKISEEENRLSEIKDEYKDGIPDRLGSERHNYQRYLDRVERLREEINVREKNLNVLKNELQNLPGKSK